MSETPRTDATLRLISVSSDNLRWATAWLEEHKDLVWEGLAELHAENSRLRSELEAAMAALKAAVPIIRAWHGPQAFDIYYEHSPEMKLIRECLAQRREGDAK